MVLATTFGASGYFYSITKQTFPVGFGIAWNNLTTNLPPVFLPHVDLTIAIIRGEGIVAADNSPETFTVKDGDRLCIRTSTETAKILRVE